MLLQHEEQGVSFVVVCKRYEWGEWVQEWVYEEGGKSSGFLFTLIINVLRRPPDYLFYTSLINVNVDSDIMASPPLTNPTYFLL